MVVDEFGNPVQGATITVLVQQLSTTTASDGSYSIAPVYYSPFSITVTAVLQGDYPVVYVGETTITTETTLNFGLFHPHICSGVCADVFMRRAGIVRIMQADVP